MIAGRYEQPINSSSRTLYRMFKRKYFDFSDLRMKRKRKCNSHKERLGRQNFRLKLSDRETGYTAFKEEFGHLKDDTIVGIHHKNAVVTLVERLLKVIIILNLVARLQRIWKQSSTRGDIISPEMCSYPLLSNVVRNSQLAVNEQPK